MGSPLTFRGVELRAGAGGTFWAEVGDATITLSTPTVTGGMWSVWVRVGAKLTPAAHVQCASAAAALRAADAVLRDLRRIKLEKHLRTALAAAPAGGATLRDLVARVGAGYSETARALRRMSDVVRPRRGWYELKILSIAAPGFQP